MAVKSSISLTDQQDEFIRQLVQQGRYASVSAAVQHGVELLRSKSEAEETEMAALRKIIKARRDGQFRTSASMRKTIATIAQSKRRMHGL